MTEDKGIRDVHVRRGVDKAACHAPVRGGQGMVQVAFGLDAAEALLLDSAGPHVPANRFHGGILLNSSQKGRAKRDQNAENRRAVQEGGRMPSAIGRRRLRRGILPGANTRGNAGPYKEP